MIGKIVQHNSFTTSNTSAFEKNKPDFRNIRFERTKTEDLFINGKSGFKIGKIVPVNCSTFKRVNDRLLGEIDHTKAHLFHKFPQHKKIIKESSGGYGGKCLCDGKAFWASNFKSEMTNHSFNEFQCLQPLCMEYNVNIYLSKKNKKCVDPLATITTNRFVSTLWNGQRVDCTTTDNDLLEVDENTGELTLKYNIDASQRKWFYFSIKVEYFAAEQWNFVKNFMYTIAPINYEPNKITHNALGYFSGYCYCQNGEIYRVAEEKKYRRTFASTCKNGFAIANNNRDVFDGTYKSYFSTQSVECTKTGTETNIKPVSVS